MARILFPPQRCIYCGEELKKVRRGEHIVPEAIGGRWTIADVCGDKKVCNRCNHEVLSDLDKELCSKSIMSAVAVEEIGGFIAQTWDVDHWVRDLLVEARPDFKRKSMTTYPQMIFEPAGPQIRGDMEEMQQFGWDAFAKVCVRRMREAFDRYRSGEKKSLHEHRFELNPSLLSRYRYPPRIFSRKPIREFRRGMSFEFHYVSVADKNSALRHLDNWNYDFTHKPPKVGIGTELPTIRYFYDEGKVVRALLKIGINLLAAFCPNTPVDRDHFRRPVDLIMDGSKVQRGLFRTLGFVEPAGVQSIATAAAHSFRLVHDGGVWFTYMAFFGGRIAAKVDFPGPNGEQWNTADVVLPYREGDYSVRTHKIMQPLATRTENSDFNKIIPSVEAINVEVVSVVKQVRRRKKPDSSAQP